LGRFSGASGRLNTFNVGLLWGFLTPDFYRVNFEVNNLKPFPYLAFPHSIDPETARKWLVLMTGFRSARSADCWCDQPAPRTNPDLFKAAHKVEKVSLFDPELASLRPTGLLFC